MLASMGQLAIYGTNEKGLRVQPLCLSTDSLQNVPDTWFTHFGIWGSARRD